MILISLITNNSYLHPLQALSRPMHPEPLFILSHEEGENSGTRKTGHWYENVHWRLSDLHKVGEFCPAWEQFSHLIQSTLANSTFHRSLLLGSKSLPMHSCHVFTDKNQSQKRWSSPTTQSQLTTSRDGVIERLVRYLFGICRVFFVGNSDRSRGRKALQCAPLLAVWSHQVYEPDGISAKQIDDKKMTESVNSS